ncbi:MAG: bacillithiol biosynthesis cysteine-adding enzyme BshC, partial [Bacteroidia bacterium]
NPNCFTITTGQQLGLLLGPLYTVIKISNAISLALRAEADNPGKRIIPVFWMASEDHDIEEINHFHYKHKKFVWNTSGSGPAGRLSTEGVLTLLKEAFGEQHNLPAMQDFADLCTVAYSKPTLAEATRFLTHHLFAETNLLILDADHPALKREFSPVILRDITDELSYKASRKAIDELSESYKIQVEGREINFFYMADGYRERIERSSTGFSTVDSRFNWTADSLSDELSRHPEAFSPNVMMRPVYQEFILPNLAYIGGAAEVAYWLELKPVFEAHQVSYPVLILRNSVMFLNRVNHHRFKNSGLRPDELLLPLHELEKANLLRHSNLDYNLTQEKAELETWFEKLESTASQIQPSLGTSARAMKQRFLHQTERFALKLIREAKKKERTGDYRVHEIYAHLHPNNSLQERVYCIPHFLEEYSFQLLGDLTNHMVPEGKHMLIFKY